MYNGILNVYKEAGYTSHDVVAKLRGICKQKKIGHTGTLDPEAVGVLPVCFGSGTKLCDLLTDWDKEYIAALRLGLTTDTQDITGQVLSKADEEALANLDEEQVRESILQFLGGYEQIPPMYSALKVNGKKLYELARAGKEVERKPRPVTISELEILEFALPLVHFRVVCSKGTYIRTLCHDIGKRLSVGGVMESLTRSRVGIFTIDKALTLAKLEKLRDENRISDVMILPDAVFPDLRAVKVGDNAVRLLKNGNRIPENLLAQGISLEDGEEVRMYDRTGQFYGIYQYHSKERDVKPVKMFLPE
ncbi:MAG: tRNA pseudouridine(55) synthase TruB [Lachnospiraceae bacterium]|nr:tRNA pseudouridine(55) synthase TruB [Lachnospiraceae bacterium]